MRKLMVLALVLLVVGLFSVPTGALAKPGCKVVDQDTRVRYDNLQDAVDAADSGATLKVKGTCYGTTEINRDVTIRGNGPAVLDGEHEGSVLTITSGVVVAIDGLTITHGSAESHGGGIHNAGDLTLTKSTVSGNQAPDGVGGGIYSSNDDGFPLQLATLTLTNSTVSGNSAYADGGGIVSLGVLTLTNSEVSGNTAGADFGGGIWNGGHLTLTNSEVSGNTSLEHGGGIYNRGTDIQGTATLTDSEVSGNTAERYGGGIYNARSGTLTLANSTVSGNTAGYRGGGIYNDENSTLTLTSSSTVSGNTAGTVVGVGGGIYNLGDLVLTSSLVAVNTASINGGGISNDGTATLTNSTVSGNTAERYGGGIYNDEDLVGELTLTNSTVSWNTADVDGGGIYNQADAGKVWLTNVTFNDNDPNDCVGCGF